MGVRDDEKRKAIVLDDEEAVEAEEQEEASARKIKKRKCQSSLKKKRAFVEDVEDDEGEEDEEEEDDAAAGDELYCHSIDKDHIDLKPLKTRGKGKKSAEDDEESRFWKIKCRQGEELQAVCILLNNDRKLHCVGKASLTRCAIAPPHSKGFILVEADSEANAKKACRGCEQLKTSSIALQSQRAVTNLLDASVNVGFKVNDSVRMKSGTYKGDTAEVLEVLLSRQQLRVKLIPRLDLEELNRVKSDKKINKYRTYPQKHITLDEVKSLNLPVKLKTDAQGRSLYCVNNRYDFWDGFIVKTVSWKSVESDAKPKSKASGVTNSSLTKGVRVEVLEGSFSGTVGEVEKLEGDLVYVRFAPKSVCRIRRNQLTKHFELGAHVHVASGIHCGAAGKVVNVERHHIVLSDASEDIRVPKECVEERDDTVRVVTQLGDYQVYDLVSLNSSVSAMILKIENDAFVVLKGIAEQTRAIVKPMDVHKKIFDKLATAQDSVGNVVRLKGMVRVLSGPLKGKQGLVQHIHGGFLFIHDRQYVDNGGYLCTKANLCLLLGGEKSPSQFKSPVRTAPLKLRNPLIGKQVKVRRGPFKGYRGQVKRSLNDFFYVFLEAHHKEVKVQHDQVVSLEEEAPPPPPCANGNAAPGAAGGWEPADAGGGSDDAWGAKEASDNAWGANEGGGLDGNHEGGGGSHNAWGANEGGGGSNIAWGANEGGGGSDNSKVNIEGGGGSDNAWGANEGGDNAWGGGGGSQTGSETVKEADEGGGW